MRIDEVVYDPEFGCLVRVTDLETGRVLVGCDLGLASDEWKQ